jgi:transcriptional regulator of acetoin/glycerol metabolism
MTIAQLEAEHIRRVLEHVAGNTTKAAKSLGISRSTLWRKMRQYSL